MDGTGAPQNLLDGADIVRDVWLADYTPRRKRNLGNLRRQFTFQWCLLSEQRSASIMGRTNPSIARLNFAGSSNDGLNEIDIRTPWGQRRVTLLLFAMQPRLGSLWSSPLRPSGPARDDEIGLEVQKN